MAVEASSVSATVATLLPAATLALGIVGTLLAEALRDGRHRRLLQDERRREREATVADRRETFELENLHATHASLVRLGRATMRYHMLDLQAARAFGFDYASRNLGSLPEEEDLGQELLLANQSASANIRLLLDDGVRRHTDDACAALVDLSRTPKPVDQANNELNAAIVLMNTALGEIATRIRSIYGPGTSPA